MQEGSWNNSAVWTITHARLITTDYKFSLVKLFKPFEFRTGYVCTKFTCEWNLCKREFVWLKNTRATVMCNDHTLSLALPDPLNYVAARIVLQQTPIIHLKWDWTIAGRGKFLEM